MEWDIKLDQVHVQVYQEVMAVDQDRVQCDIQLDHNFQEVDSIIEDQWVDHFSDHQDNRILFVVLSDRF